MTFLARTIREILRTEKKPGALKGDWSTDWNRHHPEPSSHEFVEFWQTDDLRNIVPPSNEMPAGYDETAFLRRLSPVLGADSVVEIGCGYGRLAPAFSRNCYLGLDINPKAIGKARKLLPDYRFDVIGFAGPYPEADLYLAYTVFLHVDDKHMVEIARDLSKACRKLLIVEILDPSFRQAPSAVPNFVRSRMDYERTFDAFKLEFELRRPYAHYPGTDLSYLLLKRKESDQNGP